jgi:SAM-dependent methyltransferase
MKELINIKLHSRTTCRLCDSSNIELVVKLDPIPPQEQYVDTPHLARQVPVFPIDLYMCSDCGHVQQLDVLDSETLWEGYTYLSGKANGMVEHFSQFAADVVRNYDPTVGSLVVDIGSNDGSLLHLFREQGYAVLGVDPATEIARLATESGIKTIPALLTLNLAREIVGEYGHSSVITAFNAFAHADDLAGIAESIKFMLAPDGLFFFEVQYLLDVIDKMLIGSIFHEHMSHHSVKPMRQFLARFGLEVIDIQRVPIQHGSLIGTVQHVGAGRQIKPSVEDFLRLELDRTLHKPAAIRVFAKNLEKQREKISELRQQWRKENASVAGYGAARSGQTLISQLRLSGEIAYIVDDHPQKLYKYPAGDGIQILPTKELYKRMPDYTVILAWVHAENIIANNQSYLNRGGKFVVLCPDIRVISGADFYELSERIR